MRHQYISLNGSKKKGLAEFFFKVLILILLKGSDGEQRSQKGGINVVSLQCRVIIYILRTGFINEVAYNYSVNPFPVPSKY